MHLQQIPVVVLCVFVFYHSSYAVVNNAKSVASPEAGSSSSSSNINSASSTIPDSVTASSEKDTNRRELPAGGFSDSYGAPLPSNTYGVPFDTYGPPVPSNQGFPVPVYGVPDSPTNNVVYPAPPPDIPPPIQQLPAPTYGPPKPIYGPPKPVYGPPLKLHTPSHHKTQFNKPSFLGSFDNSFKIPKPSYGPPQPSFIRKPHIPKPIYGPPKLSKPNFGFPLKFNFAPPKNLFGSHKPSHGPIKVTNSFGSPLATYGPPHTSFVSSTYGAPQPGPVYGPPQPGPAYGPPQPGPAYGPPQPGPVYGPPEPGPIYGPPQPGPIYGPPQSGHAHGPPKAIYGPPKDVSHKHHPHHPAPVYGLPNPVPHGPPHPGAPAPPTPPDIKYDGWQPILGLVSHPPSNSYGAPQQGGYSDVGLTPPNDFSLTYASSFAHGSDSSLNVPSDSYGAPLNTVTGSGGVVSSSGHDHNSHGGFGSFGGQDSSLSVIKSIGYELVPNGNGGRDVRPIDSYGAPPANSFSSDGPYAAALAQNGNSFQNFGSSNLGLIPPSGLYGVPPNSHYGTPLLSPPKQYDTPNDSYGPPTQQLNALDINPPKSPVVFREPVPPGLLQSIGDSVAHKDAHGIELSQTNFQGQQYIPPPIPDITKQKDFGGNINAPSNLYSLPNTGAPTSFQSVAHGGGGSFGSTGINFDGGHALTSYTAPLNIVDSSYGVPLQSQALTGGFDQNYDFSKQTFGGSFTSNYALPQINLQSTLPIPGHDCSQKSQPLNSYGIPSDSASSYSASISALNTNIGGQSTYQVPTFNFANNDFQSVHSAQSVESVQQEIQNNAVDIQGKSIGQQYFGKDADMQASQEVHFPNGVQNIPVQGNLGSYTLQIQSADGLDGQHGKNIPHEQVLSEGLLQSILSAIEQPDQHQQFGQQQQFGDQQLQFGDQQLQFGDQQQQFGDQQQHYGDQQQHFGDLQHGSSSPAVSYQQQNSQISDGEAQHSVTRQIVVTPPPSESNSTPESVPTSTTPSSEVEQPVPVIDNNEIALYFNSNTQNQDEKTQVLNSESSADVDDLGVRNGQQYGSFVSFKTPHSSYIYGELKSNNTTVEKTE